MYIAVLGATAMVTVIGLTALTAVRIEARSLHGGGDAMEAALYAQSAIEMGRYKIRSDPNWRTNFLNGIWEDNRPIGNGRYTLEGIDPIDGFLAGILTHPVLLKGTGIKGDARYKLEVKLQPAGRPLTCLEAAAHAGTDVTFTGATVSGVGIISANNNMSASSSSITLPAQAVNNISGGGYFAGKTVGIAPRSMPDVSVFDFYTDPMNSAVINYAGIPKSGGVPTIQNVVLSPSSNPYGSTNAGGVYVINCAGGNLRIRNSRIVGTLVVLNPATFSVLDSINWQAPVANYPALLVQGSAQLSYTSVALLENLISYPSVVTGLIYASDDITATNSVTVTGVIVAGRALKPQGTLALTYSGVYLLNPAPGFGTAAGEMQVVAGTWKRIVN